MEGEDPFNWTFTRTNIYLDLIINRLPKFRNPKILKLSLWAEILEELNVHYPGNVLDAKKLKKKFDNMKKTFVKNKDSNDMEKALQWPYFKRMDQVVNYLSDKSDEIPNISNAVFYEVDGATTEIFMDPAVVDEAADPGFQWSNAATNLLLEIMEEKLGSGDVKIKNFWAIVTDTFLYEYESPEPPDLDIKKISKKFSNMKKTYLKNKRKLKQGISNDWPYFKQLERIVENHYEGTNNDDVIASDDLVDNDESMDENNAEIENTKNIKYDEEAVQGSEPEPVYSEEDWIEFEMLEEEENPLEPKIELNDRRCRVCFEAVTTYKNFSENIQTCSGQEVSIGFAFAFSTKYELGNAKSDNILCFSCTNSLKFVYEFLEKAEETKQKFDKRTHFKPEAKNVVRERFEKEKTPDIDDIIEEERGESCESDSNTYDIEQDAEEKTTEYSGNSTNESYTSTSASTKKSQKYICGKCKRPFTSETLLRRHIKIVHRLNEYPCVVCDKSFSTSNLLHRHTSQVHRPGRDFQCPQCKKAFQYKERLTAHMRIHSEKTQVCNICNKAYVTSKELTIHMRTHTNERPYKCEYCSDTFAQKDRLTHHVKKKHLNVVYKCKYCQVFSSANHNTTRRHEMEHFKFAYECDLCPKKYSKRDRFVVFVVMEVVMEVQLWLVKIFETTLLKVLTNSPSRQYSLRNPTNVLVTPVGFRI